MFVAFTTVDSPDWAETLAREAVGGRLAACAQVEGPITSHYWWEGKLEKSQEWRVMFKCLPARLEELKKWVLSRHPYDTPEWIAVRAEEVGEKYLSWARSTSTSSLS